MINHCGTVSRPLSLNLLVNALNKPNFSNGELLVYSFTDKPIFKIYQSSELLLLDVFFFI